MRMEERERLLGILKHGLEHGGAVHGEAIVKSPLADFTCPDLLAEEQRVFFRETPLFMGLSGDLPTNGSYWADSQTGSAILMTRDDAGHFRAFANSCRHRGAQVVPDGRGARARFACPFHAWTYNSGGDLIAVNRAERFGDVDKTRYGLVELPSAEVHGMLWVRPTPGEEIDVDACLGTLADDMSHWGLSRQVYVESQVLEARTNWKLAVDTFGENYHFDVLHRETLAPDIKGNLQTHDVLGPNYRMVFARLPGFAEVDTDASPIGEWPFRADDPVRVLRLSEHDLPRGPGGDGRDPHLPGRQRDGPVAHGAQHVRPAGGAGPFRRSGGHGMDRRGALPGLQ